MPMNALSLPRHLEIKITPTETGQFHARKALIEGNVELKGDLTLLEQAGALFKNRSAFFLVLCLSRSAA